MNSNPRKTVSVLLSVLFPGLGHLYLKQYIMGTMGIILGTWSLIIVLLSGVVFNPHEGLGSRLFPVSCAVFVGLWAILLLSVIFKGIHFRREIIDVSELAEKGYTAFLVSDYETSQKIFEQIVSYETDNVAARLMVALNLIYQKRERKALQILKRMQSHITSSHWLWEIDVLISGLQPELRP